MHTNDLSAAGASPSFLFGFNEIPHAERFYMFEIFNHTHSIPGSITMIQAVQHGTGKAVTAEAIGDAAFRHFLTVFNSARGGGFRFQTVVASATGACLPVSPIGAAEAAVHATGRNQRCFIFQPFLHHIRISANTSKC
jgi:hypothetical protein